MRMVFKLVVSVIIDLIGFVSYAIPILSEVADIIWAPIRYVQN